MNIKAYALYGLVRLMRPLRWGVAQCVMFFKGAFHYFQHGRNLLETLLVLGVSGSLIMVSGIIYEPPSPHHAEIGSPLMMNLGVLFAMVLWTSMIFLKAKKSHHHIQDSFMNKQAELELRFALEKAVPKANHIKSASRL